MERHIFVAACVAFICSQSLAKTIEIGFDIGFGLGAGQNLVGSISEQNSSGYTTKYDEVYSSGGNGIKINGSATYYLNDNLGILVVAGGSCFGGYHTKYPAGSEFFIDSYYGVVNLGLKLKTKMGRVSPYVYIAPGLFFPAESGIFDDNRAGYPTESSDISIKYAPGFGFTAGMGVMVALGDRTGLVAELAPTYAFADEKEHTFTSEDGFNSRTVYLNETSTLPANTGNTTYLHGRPRRSFSSIAPKIGMYFSF